MYTNGHVKFHSVISIIRLSLPKVPHDAGASQHDPTESYTQSYTVKKQCAYLTSKVKIQQLQM